MHENSAWQVIEEDLIPFKVWSGFYTQEQILEEAVEALTEGWYENEEEDEESIDCLSDEQIAKLKKIIASRFDEKRKAEKNWPESTDCDRLQQAFAELTERGIVSLENAGYTLSDGWSEWDEVVTNEWHAKGLLNKVRGGCFYHGQDLERAVNGAGLNLAFSAISGEDSDGLPIGHEIMEVLKKHGFKPSWNGSITERIFMPIAWQKRLDNGD
ncbi:MAG: hypothetical protein SFV17_01310 [Candidatus Obscuribacter sp.]|nr:hypothetical protein [Candidatus Melainabacteria bacterium]MDX1985300.1 hypothetical protein [Candidatus Obscuribacter sp.]